MSAESREALRLLFSAWQAGRLYSAEHPQFKALVERAYEQLTTLLSAKSEWTMALIGDDIVGDEETFYDLKEKLHLFSQGLKERSLERISFSAGLKKEELLRFLAFISLPQKRSEQDLAEFFHLEGIRHIKAGRLTAGRGQKELVAAPSLPLSYQASLQAAASFIGALNRGEEVSSLDLHYMVLSILENFCGRYWQLLGIWPSLAPEEKLFSHLVNTALLVMTAATRLGFPRDDVLDLGLAGLGHDLGKLSPLGIGIFGGESHMLAGAKKLLRFKNLISPLPAIVALEHHLRFDLKGQPKLKGIETPHEASLLVSVSNVYDNLLKKWAFDPRFEPLFIYHLMMAEKGKVFAPDWLESFFRVMGVWPEGSTVLLSDGRRGVVSRNNENLPLQPQVEVIEPEEAREVIDLSKEKEKITIIKAINPFSA